jgi:hypothetical protein
MVAGFGLRSYSSTLAANDVAQALAVEGATYQFLQDFILKASETNLADIFIGDASVDNTGFSLPAGGSISGALLRTAMAQNDASNWDMSKIYIYGTMTDVLEILHAKR